MRKIAVALLAVMLVLSLAASVSGKETQKQNSTVEQSAAYSYTEYPLERNGIDLHLACMEATGMNPDRNILLIHGVTYSSHEFDIDYEDYSLVRFLAREGYAVWRLDIAGFGQSEEVDDGFLPDSDYAAEDIHAAVDKICELSGQDKIDLLGWSWGTVTTGRFVSKNPEHIDRLVLFAPILSGLGKTSVTEPFHHNTWEHAADDFQKSEDGTFDHSVTDPAVIEFLCSSSWHYDKESSPNGGRRDICVDKTQSLIDLKKITVPTLVICGDKDPYLDYDRVNAVLDDLPDGSALEVIEGASHVAFLEKPYYHDFQDRLMEFLGNANAVDEESNVPDATLIIHDVNEEIPGLIASGEADVMITEIMEAGYYVGQDERLAAPLIYEPFTNGQLGVLMPKGSEDLLDYLNEFLEEEKRTGRLDELAEESIYRYVQEAMDEFHLFG